MYGRAGFGLSSFAASRLLPEMPVSFCFFFQKKDSPVPAAPPWVRGAGCGPAPAQRCFRKRAKMGGAAGSHAGAQRSFRKRAKIGLSFEQFPHHGGPNSPTSSPQRRSANNEAPKMAIGIAMAMVTTGGAMLNKCDSFESAFTL